MKNNLVLIILLIFSLKSTAQISYGKITFERKTNLYKKYKNDDDIDRWIKPEDKNKVDVFELYFNDSLSAFKPLESDLKEQLSWATSQNSVYQDLNRKSTFTIKSIWGEKLNVTDTLRNRKWKITENKRKICGYECRKAIWQADDSTKIYAWYCDEINLDSGPETFNGLPGMILGLAAEDGGVVYFAKSIDLAVKPDMPTLLPKKSKQKVYTSKELRTKLEKDYGKEKWGKKMIANVFGYW